jgi:hypothetical protein
MNAVTARRLRTGAGAVFTAAAVVLCSIVAAHPGAAGTVPAGTPSAPPRPQMPWTTAGCATGTIGPATSDPTWFVQVPATATACAGHDPAATFTLVAFRPADTAGMAYASEMQPYAASGPAPVTGVYQATYWTRTIGMCVVRDTADRLACIRIDMGADGAVTTAIAADDPLVAKPIKYYDDRAMPKHNGFCATCVGWVW